MLLRKDKLDALLEALSASAIVYVPKTVNGVSKFAPYVSEQACEFDAVNTLMPPKDMLFPQSQRMYHYGIDANNQMFVDPIIEGAPAVVFGIRSCDMAAIDCLDEVFFTKGYVDEYYEKKRKLLTTVAIGCTSVNETCFCESMGLDPNNAAGADIQLRDCGDAYTVAALTDEGRAALEAWEPFVEEGDAQPEDVHCTLAVDAEHVKEQLDGLYDSAELWDDFSIKCLNCGTCTYICPSCYCFDIEQENRNKEGVRFRCWDSCMFSEYTEMAGGHNPRPTKKERVRNRFMNKLNFFEDRYGMKLCVGCGRCMEKCPVGIDITVLIEKIGEVAHA
jgi:ferredoxin